eukprot:Filipodium_phascolosomae@DN2742_c0_g1_i13.p1
MLSQKSFTARPLYSVRKVCSFKIPQFNKKIHRNKRVSESKKRQRFLTMGFHLKLCSGFANKGLEAARVAGGQDGSTAISPNCHHGRTLWRAPKETNRPGLTIAKPSCHLLAYLRRNEKGCSIMHHFVFSEKWLWDQLQTDRIMKEEIAQPLAISECRQTQPPQRVNIRVN